MLKRNTYIIIFTISIALVIGAVCLYLNQLSQTVSGNLMSTVDEISRHDVESIEGALDNSYGRLESVALRFDIYDVRTIEEAQEQLSLESASSALFNALFFLSADGSLYGSDATYYDVEEHAYDEIFNDGREHFVMLYDDANGDLGADSESLVYGIKIPAKDIGGERIVAIIGVGTVTMIRDQLLIESFNGQGFSSVVNARGYYIVGGSSATDLAGRDNFYDLLNESTIEGGMTVEQIRRNISSGESFTVNCERADGETLVLSFAPVEGTTWSLIMAVPYSVFEQRFAPFITMTVVMLLSVVVVLAIMMLLIYRFMRRSILAKAEAAARAEFLSNMSHEIRTPLNGIIGLHHLMDSSLDDPVAMEGYVRKLGTAAQYLLSLVNDILDVSKLQAGKVVLNPNPFNLNAIIDNVYEMQREAMKEKSIRFIRVDEIPYPLLIGDAVRISQVLVNILSNAVKFTPEEGAITLTASQKPVAPNDKVATFISIADTGCGMSAEFKHQIFDTFTQERRASETSQKGTGLGMSISRMLVEQMGGTIEVESEVGKGSCFKVVFTLPRGRTDLADDVRTCSESTQEPAALPKERGVAQKRTAAVEDESAGMEEGEGTQGHLGSGTRSLQLLVAEDNELNADILSAILEREGYGVQVVSNGQEAVDAFIASEEGHFAAILMDVQMPIKSGYEAAREIRTLDRSDAKAVTIFACTASTFAEDRQRAIESGMDGFLAKPLNVPDMLEKLAPLS